MGDGVADDTAAINRAASDGARCGQLCGSTTVTGALVYFPVYFFAFQLSYYFGDADQSTPVIGRNLPNQDTHNTVGFLLVNLAATDVRIRLCENIG